MIEVVVLMLLVRVTTPVVLVIATHIRRLTNKCLDTIYRQYNNIRLSDAGHVIFG